MKGAQERAKKPLFVQFVLENIWAVYDTVVIRKVRKVIPLIILECVKF
jgi:ribosome assembly protein 1